MSSSAVFCPDSRLCFRYPTNPKIPSATINTEDTNATTGMIADEDCPFDIVSDEDSPFPLAGPATIGGLTWPLCLNGRDSEDGASSVGELLLFATFGEFVLREDCGRRDASLSPKPAGFALKHGRSSNKQIDPTRFIEKRFQDLKSLGDSVNP